MSGAGSLNYYIQCVLVFHWNSIIFFLCHRLGKASFYNIHTFIQQANPMLYLFHAFIHLIYSGSHTLDLVMNLRGLATNLSHSSTKF